MAFVFKSSKDNSGVLTNPDCVNSSNPFESGDLDFTGEEIIGINEREFDPSLYLLNYEYSPEFQDARVGGYDIKSKLLLGRSDLGLRTLSQRPVHFRSRRCLARTEHLDL